MTKAQSSIKRLASFLEKLDDLGLDVDEFKTKSNSEIATLWKQIYNKDLSDADKGTSTINGYKRLANQLTKMHQEDINRLEKQKMKYRSKIQTDLTESHMKLRDMQNTHPPTSKGLLKQFNNRMKKLEQSVKKLHKLNIEKNLVKQEKIFSDEIEKLKQDDISQRKKVLNSTVKRLSQQMNAKKTNIAKNRLWLRLQRSKMKNKKFEQIVNGLIFQYGLDRREALERARLIAILPKDALATQTLTGFITPSGVCIPQNQISFYKANSP